ncbi:E3 ubiquitin-protein ligase RNF128-like [Centruroides vittatus]|uniref:E3 ubiquitin-protein ligase RNF128-like n=1 Tax=Centruroides vittatus TaxID=120091 RepID=UPI00350E9713
MNRTMLDVRSLENDFDWWFSRRSWFDTSFFPERSEDLFQQILLELLCDLRDISLYPRSNSQLRNRRTRRVPRQRNNARQQSSINITLQLPSQSGTNSISRSTDAINQCGPLAVGDDVEICAICREQFKERDNIRQLPCEHIFHPDCLRPWLQRRRTCPTCRQYLN